eukprot:gene1396-1417_t
MQGGVDDWNDFRVVLAISRAGRLTEAAKALGVDHSTAFRRLQTIEGRFGQPLFERLAGGAYAATEAGAAMVAVAERIEDEVMAVARDLAGRDHSLSGRLRLTSSETLAYRLLTRHIAAFRAAHPGVVVELSIENRVLDLSRREADVALRPMRPRQKDLWGRKLADVAWCLYRAAGGGEPGMQAVIGWDPGAADIGAADWLAANVPAAAIVFRTSSLINQMTAARAGMGVALLPCYLASCGS